MAPDATAFAHRNADLLFECEVLWEPQHEPELIAANVDWLEGYQAAMRPYVSAGAYQNFMIVPKPTGSTPTIARTLGGWWRSSGRGTWATSCASPRASPRSSESCSWPAA